MNINLNKIMEPCHCNRIYGILEVLFLHGKLQSEENLPMISLYVQSKKQNETQENK